MSQENVVIVHMLSLCCKILNIMSYSNDYVEFWHDIRLHEHVVNRLADQRLQYQTEVSSDS